jgi:hypothetical protein
VSGKGADAGRFGSRTLLPDYAPASQHTVDLSAIGERFKDFGLRINQHGMI